MPALGLVLTFRGRAEQLEALLAEDPRFTVGEAREDRLPVAIVVDTHAEVQPALNTLSDLEEVVAVDLVFAETTELSPSPIEMEAS